MLYHENFNEKPNKNWTADGINVKLSIRLLPLTDALALSMLDNTLTTLNSAVLWGHLPR